MQTHANNETSEGEGLCAYWLDAVQGRTRAGNGWSTSDGLEIWLCGQELDTPTEDQGRALQTHVVAYNQP